MYQLKPYNSLSPSQIKSIYNDKDVLKKAWPKASFPIQQNEFDLWFLDSDKVKSTALVLSEKKDDQGINIGHGAIKTYIDKPGLSYLCLLAIAKQYQGRGIGKELVKQILSYCQLSMGLSELYLMVHSSNLVALRLYESMGFHYVDGDQTKRMKIQLS